MVSSRLAPDLPGCSVFDKSKAEALTDDAIEAWIAAAKNAGNPIPHPSQMPALG
jgi:predicted RNase H-like HicB family nuclease